MLISVTVALEPVMVMNWRREYRGMKIGINIKKTLPKIEVIREDEEREEAW